MKIKTQNLDAAWQIGLLLMLSAVIVMIPDFAYAAAISQLATLTKSPADEALCLAAGWMFGNAGKAIATLGICILGAGACLGKVSWGMSMVVGVGVSIIFGAVSLIAALGGSACAV